MTLSPFPCLLCTACNSRMGRCARAACMYKIELQGQVRAAELVSPTVRKNQLGGVPAPPLASLSPTRPLCPTAGKPWLLAACPDTNSALPVGAAADALGARATTSACRLARSRAATSSNPFAPVLSPAVPRGTNPPPPPDPLRTDRGHFVMRLGARYGGRRRWGRWRRLHKCGSLVCLLVDPLRRL